MENPEQFQGEKQEGVESPNVVEAIETISGSIEISPTLDGTLAICVIKPDAFRYKDAIVKRLEDSGLYIVERRSRQLTESFIEENMTRGSFPKPVVEATKQHYMSGESEVVLVKGDDVVSKLLNVVGMKTNPALCSPETIRYVYGDHIPEELEEGLKYYRNAAHRPASKGEAKEDLEKFRNIL